MGVGATGKGTFDEYVKEVEAAAAKKMKRKPGTGSNPNSQANLPKSDLVANKAKAPVCQKVTKQLGRRCQRPAMRGGTFCHQHGGYRQTPQNPATIRRLLKGHIYEDRARTLAYQECRKYSVKDQMIIKAILKERGMWQGDSLLIIRGLIAYTMDDNGKAYRHWLKSLPKRP